ncbi:gluconate transporter [Marivirga sp. S37H4]|uniref:Gluconate transporter n=1 Tax=Marivirga aurantiaca TaxID=2802615 RepID=A0A935C7B8_9BACT|nr:gluconate:H+ symporter [Marivirga aurantiaca]MBK6264819.1 gluconate transporter [Marivirga aurantiaca]
MIEYTLLVAVLAGILVLLFLILKLKLHAFPALLISSIVVGVLAGLEPLAIMDTIHEGMANTLGFVATVVGLGAMFGAILEHSGGARIVANFLLKKFSVSRAPAAMAVAGFIIAIPVFFEVGFILLVPMIYALQRQTKKSLLIFALPLLAGLAVTHAFMPPTPGPIAVADIIGADLGWVIVIGAIIGFPTVVLGGLFYGKYIGNKIFIEAPPVTIEVEDNGLKAGKKIPGVYTILAIIAIPIILILLSTFVKSGLLSIENSGLILVLNLFGHPFSALIIANIIAWYVLGIRLGFSKKELLDITTKSMGPAGMIILITGAGGVFKQVLVNTGAGEMLASSLAGIGFPVLVFAFIVALLVRVIQGSATVAMITAAGLVSPLITGGTGNFELACIVIAIAAGGTFMSHVNDSGFWLVKELLGISEKETFKTWTIMTGILSISGFLLVFIIYLLYSIY